MSRISTQCLVRTEFVIKEMGNSTRSKRGNHTDGRFAFLPSTGPARAQQPEADAFASMTTVLDRLQSNGYLCRSVIMHLHRLCFILCTLCPTRAPTLPETWVTRCSALHSNCMHQGYLVIKIVQKPFHATQRHPSSAKLHTSVLAAKIISSPCHLLASCHRYQIIWDEQPGTWPQVN